MIVTATDEMLHKFAVRICHLCGRSERYTGRKTVRDLAAELSDPNRRGHDPHAWAEVQYGTDGRGAALWARLDLTGSKRRG